MFGWVNIFFGFGEYRRSFGLGSWPQVAFGLYLGALVLVRRDVHPPACLLAGPDQLIMLSGALLRVSPAQAPLFAPILPGHLTK